MKRILIIVCTLGVLSIACVKPEEESASKFNRQANIAKYVKKAKSVTQIAKERQQPLPIVDPLDVSRLTSSTQTVDTDFLAQSFERNRQFLQKNLQENYTQRNTEKINQLADQYKTQLQQAVQESTSPTQLADQLTSALTNQEKALKELIAQQQKQARLKPDQQSLDRAAQRIQRRCDDFINRTELYYGPQTAAAVRPILDKAIEDFEFAMASASSDKELDEKIAKIVTTSTEQIEEIVKDTADPSGITSEEEITALRADMITVHQQLENRIEYLYGKDAVLQARKPFNRLLEDAGNTLRENMRLTQKQNTLQRFNAHYKDSLLDLQEQWNKDLNAADSAQ